MPSLLEKCEVCGGGLGFCRMLASNKSFTYYQCCVPCARRVGNAVAKSLLRQMGIDTRVLPMVPTTDTRRTKAKKAAPLKRNVTRIETPDSITLRTIPYGEYLLTDHWRMMRIKTLRRFGGRCAVCNSDQNLQVHHRTYERLGQELLSDLTALCSECHAGHHGKTPVKR